MSDPKRYVLNITGLTPLLFNRFPSQEEEAEKKSVRDKTQFEREHVLNRLYRTNDGEIYIPSNAIHKCLTMGCRFVPEKPKGSFKSYGPLIEAALVIEDDAILNVDVKKLVPFEAAVSLNTSRGKGGGTGTRVRPMVPLPWATKTSCIVVDDGITKDMLAVIADRAGRLCGLMDGRKIGMGRCQIGVTNGH